MGNSNKNEEKSKIVINIEDNVCFDPKKIAQYMNNFFLNIASVLVNNLPSPPNIFTTFSSIVRNFYINKNITPNSFILNPISEQFVNNELCKLNVNKSPWYDEISAKFQKDTASKIKIVVTYLVNLSIYKN